MRFIQEETRPSTALSIEVQGLATTSFIIKQTFDECNLPFKKRLSPRQGLLKKTKHRGRFVTFLDEEADHCSQKIQVLERLRKEFALCQGGLATMKVIKICSHSSIKKINNKNKIKKDKMKLTKKVERGAAVVSKEVPEKLEKFITREMNGVDIKLVIQKWLFASDVNPGLNRLNMPIKQLETHEFLKADEKLFRKIDKQNEIEVRLVGPTLQMYNKPMKLKMWEQGCSYNYVLITNWKHFVADNKRLLKEGTMVQVWSFRRNEQLCFALVVVG